jgi:hypothetical protein
LCLGFDFDFPSRVEEAGDYHHRGDGARSLKKFAVDGTHGRGVVSAGEEHAGADDVVEGRSRFAQRVGDDRKASAGLFDLGTRNLASAPAPALAPFAVVPAAEPELVKMTPSVDSWDDSSGIAN